MSSRTKEYDSNSDDLSLTDVVLGVRRFVNEALRVWWLFAMLFLIIGGYLVYQAVKSEPTYQATFTFMINEDDGGGISGMASILGQFGLGMRRGRYNLDKVVELLRSRRIIQKTVLKRAEINEQEDFIANHILAIYELPQKWAERDPEFEGFRFRNDSVVQFNQLERSALLRIHRKLIGTEKTTGLVASSFSEESNILRINARTINEDLTLAIVNHMFESLSAFYIEQSTERQLNTYNVVRSKVDSVAAALATAQREYARISDANQGVFLRSERLREAQLYQEIEKLAAIQKKAVENLELAEFALKNATPFVQEIDRPIPPLKKDSKSPIKAAVIGALVAFAIGGLWLLGRMLWQSVLAPDLHNNE